MTLQEIKDYICEEGLDTKSRERSLVYRRFYLFKYLYVNFGLTHNEIAHLFNRANHTSVLHGLKQFRYLSMYEDFHKLTKKERELFNIDEHRVDRTSLNRTPIQWSEAEYTKIVEIRDSKRLSDNVEAIKFIINDYLRKD